MRLDRLRQKMAEDELAGFLVTQPENRRYLSGFTGSAGVLIITKDKQLLATDFRYYEQVRQQCPDWELIELKYNFGKKLLEILREVGLGGHKVGFEAQDMSIAALHKWERVLEGRLILVHTENFVEQLRMSKDAQELVALNKAIALADETWEYIAVWLKPGMSEKQVAWELESYMRTHGAEAISFSPIVASGVHSAKPHATPTDKLLQAGEPITIDFGCVVDGYCSDITRTVSLGKPADDKYLTIWNIVLQAQQAAIEQAKAGMTGKEVDNLAREVIKKAGYGEYFGHGLGHGVGLNVHEPPRFSFMYPDKIPTRSTVTVEPGIYIPGWGGVRLEEIVFVNDDGVAVMTNATKKAVLE